MNKNNFLHNDDIKHQIENVVSDCIYKYNKFLDELCRYHILTGNPVYYKFLNVEGIISNFVRHERYIDEFNHISYYKLIEHENDKNGIEFFNIVDKNNE